MNSKQLKELIRRPEAMAKFQATGQLPRGTKPVGPLIDLLSQIAPRDRIAIRNLTVDQKLGYSGSRAFATAEQALRWIAPQGAGQEVFGSFPADSWRDKRRNERLYIEDLLERAGSAPESLADRYKHLQDPARRRARQALAASEEEGMGLGESDDQNVIKRPRP